MTAPVPTLLATLAFASACAAALAAPPLPERDLLVELRQVEGTAGEAGVTLSSRARSTTLRLRVRNGAPAQAALAESRPLQWWQLSLGPQGPVALPATLWLQGGRSVWLQPRWPGGRAPVTVEFAAEAAAFDASVAPGSAEAPPRRAQRLLTTVQIPLDAWVTVAGAAEDEGARGTLSTRAAAGAQRLELRVSLP